jgi:quinolinate synthase
MLANPDYTPEVAAATAPFYDHVKTVIPAVEWPVHALYRRH